MTRERLLCTPAELYERLQTGHCTVLDSRFNLMQPTQGADQYRDAHIPGAAYVHLDNELSSPPEPNTGRHPLPSPEQAALMFARKGVSAEVPVVVYDGQDGSVAARAWWMLRWLGHDNVRLLEGGFEGWHSLALPLESGEVSVTAGRFTATHVSDWVLDTSSVNTEEGAVLVDARAKARFDGSQEPIDPVAGHIPGAINLPFEQTIDEHGHFLGEEQLSSLWVDTIGNAENVTVMCGSGVTACHLAISALLAGRPMPRLYAGSWSEWIRDPSRAIARS